MSAPLVVGAAGCRRRWVSVRCRQTISCLVFLVNVAVCTRQSSRHNTMTDSRDLVLRNDVEFANSNYVRAAWTLIKEEEKDSDKRNRCAGGMPSHLYCNRDYDDALDNLHTVAMQSWHLMTIANRLHALETAQDECSGCPALLQSLHELLCSGPVTEGPLLSGPMGNVESAIEILESHYKIKKGRRKRAKRDAQQCGTHCSSEESESDDGEWEAAGF